MGFPAVDGSFSQLATSEGGNRHRRGLDHLPKAGCSRSEPWAQALTTKPATDRQSCTHRPEAWTKSRRASRGDLASSRNQHITQLSSRVFSPVQTAVPPRAAARAMGRSLWGHTQGRS